MNKRTLVSVHGYLGDAHQIKNNLPLYEHHKCSVVIFSPDDSKIEKMGPHICRFGGKRQYIGAESLQRQQIQMKMLLDYPFDWFLLNDSDSFCITPEIPRYLYKERGILWSNEVSDAMHTRPTGYPWPQLAFQPPYFCSREVIEILTKATVAPDPKTPFIDWVMQAWATQTKCPHKNYADGMSCPTSDQNSASVMSEHVLNHGKVMLHSIKTLSVMKHLIRCRDHRKKWSAGGTRKVNMSTGYPIITTVRGR